MSQNPLDLAQRVLDVLEDVDTFTAATAVVLAHMVLDHRQAIAIQESCSLPD